MRTILRIICVAITILLSGCATHTYSLYQSDAIKISSYKKIAVHYFDEGKDVEDPIAVQYMTQLLINGLKRKDVEIYQYREILNEFKKRTPNYDTLSLKEKAKLLTDWELQNFDLIVVPLLTIYKTVATYRGPYTIPFPAWNTQAFSGFFGSSYFYGSSIGSRTEYITIPGGYVPTGVVVLEIFIVNKDNDVIWHFFDKKFSQRKSTKELGEEILNDAMHNMPFKSVNRD